MKEEITQEEEDLSEQLSDVNILATKKEENTTTTTTTTTIKFDHYDLYFKTTQSHSFKTLIDSLKDITNDVVLHASKEGIYMETLDESNVMIATFNLKASEFQQYFCRFDIEMGMNLQNLFKLIRSIDSHDVLTLYMNRQDSTKLYIIVESVERNLVEHSFLTLLDFHYEMIIFPSVDYSAVIEMSTSEFQKIIKDFAYMGGDRLRVRTQNNKLVLSVTADSTEKNISINGNVSNRNNSNNNSNNNNDQEFDEQYPLHQISKITKCTNLCVQLSMHLAHEMPIVLIYTVGMLGTVKFLLSPFRKQEDE